jgi:hypothetical protein
VNVKFIRVVAIASVFFAGTKHGFTQVYQQGIVGYNNCVFSAGTNYFSLVFKIGASNLLENVFYTSAEPGAPEGTTVSFWNPTNLSFDVSSIYTNGAWSENLVITPGVGIMVVAPVTFTNTIAGVVYNHDGNILTTNGLVLPPGFSNPPGIYLLGDACQVADMGTNVFLNILGRLPYPGQKVTTVSTTSTYLGNSQWDVVPSLKITEAAFFTTLPEPPPVLSISLTNNQAIVSWTPTVSSWKLQTNASIDSVGWNDSNIPATNNPVTNNITSGNLFFRLVPAN